MHLCSLGHGVFITLVKYFVSLERGIKKTKRIITYKEFKSNSKPKDIISSLHWSLKQNKDNYINQLIKV